MPRVAHSVSESLTPNLVVTDQLVRLDQSNVQDVYELTRFIQTPSTSWDLARELDLFREMIFFHFIGHELMRVTLVMTTKSEPVIIHRIPGDIPLESLLFADGLWEVIA
jgi:hypothetical protein